MDEKELQLDATLNYWHNEKVGIMYQLRKINLTACMEGRDIDESEKDEKRRLLSESDKVQVKIKEAEEALHQYYIERYDNSKQ